MRKAFCQMILGGRDEIGVGPDATGIDLYFPLRKGYFKMTALLIKPDCLSR